MSNEILTYINYDFDYLMTQLQNRLKLNDSWKDTYRSGTGQMLIELYAAVGNLVLFYVERRAEESYILTAKNRSSIINLVRLLNYVPRRKASSSGTLQFSMSTVATKMVFIPKYTSCQTSGLIKFLVSEDVVIMPNQISVDASAIQGEIVSLNYVSTGAINQEYKINDTSVENTNIFVSVNGEIWTATTSFIDSTTNSKNYVIRAELDDTISVVFGDGIFGKSPGSGDAIFIEYIRSSGVSGNVYELAKITTLNDTIFDEDSASVSVSVTNTTVFLGGENEESTEEIRWNAPKVFATGDRAVTKEDFTAILEDYAGVANANAWGENEENPPNYNMYNQVKLVVLLQDWQLPDAAFKSLLSTYLYTKSLMTVRYSYVDPDVLEIIPVMTIKALRGSTLSYIESQIDAALSDQFVLGSTARLGTSKRISDVIASIEAVSGVSYSHTTLKIRKVLPKLSSPANTYSSSITALPVLPASIEVYVNNTQVGIDNGSGGWTSTGAYTLTGSVNYTTTGLCTITFSPALGVSDVVSVKYKQNQNGDVVVTMNQICKLYDTEYTSISYV
jgi:hypothetical protein